MCGFNYTQALLGGMVNALMDPLLYPGHVVNCYCGTLLAQTCWPLRTFLKLCFWRGRRRLRQRIVKQINIPNSYTLMFFIPVAVETLGSFGPGAAELVTSLGRRLVEFSGDPRSAFFLKQRIDVAVQRGNVLSVLGTFPSAVRSADISFV